MDGTYHDTISHPATQWLGEEREVCDGIRARTRVEQLGADITVAVVEAQTTKDVVYGEQGPPTVCIAVYLTGRGRASLETSDAIEILPGTVVLFMSDKPIGGQHWHDGGQKLSVVDVRFRRELFDRVGGVTAARLSQELYSGPSIPEKGALLSAFQGSAKLIEIVREIRNCSIGAPPTRELYLTAKSLELLATTLSDISAAASETISLSAEDRRKIALARELLETRYEESWRIRTLASVVGLSEKKLKAGFRETIGNSVHAYLLEVRINAACALLSEGRSVTEVALSSGFGNLSHFTTMFRKLRGMTPSEYRKRAQQS